MKTIIIQIDKFFLSGRLLICAAKYSLEFNYFFALSSCWGPQKYGIEVWLQNSLLQN